VLKEICLSTVGGRATKILKAERATALEFRKPSGSLPHTLFGSRKVLPQRLEFDQRGAAHFHRVMMALPLIPSFRTQ
jgi:hypothetical protein